jgi:hypothetical protein
MGKILRPTLRKPIARMALMEIQSALLPDSPEHGNKIRWTETPVTPSPLGIVTNGRIVRPAAGKVFAFEQYAPASRARRQMWREC